MQDEEIIIENENIMQQENIVGGQEVALKQEGNIVLETYVRGEDSLRKDDGTEKSKDDIDEIINSVVFKGEIRTSFIADTYALHNRMPLKARERCLLWVRYGMCT